MNKKTRLMRSIVATALSTLMAASVSHVLLTAVGVSHEWTVIYCSAFVVALFCGVGSLSGIWAAISGGVAMLTLGGILWTHPEILRSIWILLESAIHTEFVLETTMPIPASTLFGIALSTITCAVFYLLLYGHGGTSLALLLQLAVTIGCYALVDMPLLLAVPGLFAALLAFAYSSGLQRDSHLWRALIPASIAIVAALALTPANHVTWAPLENAAAQVREIFEDYFQFTEKRFAFSISAVGYDHAMEMGGDLEARLGGPAQPSTAPVMSVVADDDVLLRGAIRRTYTGHAWKDTDVKARYLYYDFSRRDIRAQMFDMSTNPEGAFDSVSVEVEMLDHGTSTLFIPGRLHSFDMNLATAVYYNSVGELFIAREVEAGDTYAAVGFHPGDQTALRAAVEAALYVEDDAYEAIQQTCLQLPSGIETGVYVLTAQLTRDLLNPYDKAVVIQNWLRSNCVYTLTPNYPNPQRDFVSAFVLDTQEGYCSYFASAMAVMCRIAGLPARYIEGYSVNAQGEQPVIVTGENAHAWVEVYFNGLGWVAFDPTNGSDGNAEGLSNEPGDDSAEDRLHMPVPTTTAQASTPEPSAEPTIAPTAGEFDATLSPEGASSLPSDGLNTPVPTSAANNPQDWPGNTNNAPPPTPQPNAFHSQRNWSELWMSLSGALILLVIVLVIWALCARMRATNPIRLSNRAASEQMAAMILYRAMLTLLAQTGQSPNNGETPSAFARRISEQMNNPDFVEFADAMALSVYGRAGFNHTMVEVGQRAYGVFLTSLKRKARHRFVLTRLFKGLGKFDNIP